MKIAIYARVSTSDQTTENQVRELTEWADRAGHEVVTIYDDNGVSGAKGREFRQEFDKLLRGAVRREFDLVAAWSVAGLGRAGGAPPRRQSAHVADYAAALKRLDGLGLLYPCFCTRKSIMAEIAHAAQAPHGPDGPLYPGTCRNLDAEARDAQIADGRAYALRRVLGKAVAIAGPLTWRDRGRGELAADPASLGDVVLARKEFAASYHLAVVLDDAGQGITLVTRGEDLFHATHVHRLLQALLDLPVPEWHHHGLITGPDGTRLAKRSDAHSIRALREAGKSPAEVRALAGFAD